MILLKYLENNKIKYDKKCIMDEYTNYYLTVPKEILIDLGFKYYDIEYATIWIATYFNSFKEEDTSVYISPNNLGEDFDWNELYVTQREYDKLIELIKKEDDLHDC